MLADASPQRAHARPPLVERHRKAAPDTLRERLDVVRIDGECGFHLRCGTRQFAEHENAIVVHARGRVFLGDQIHPVPQRCDDHHVGGAVQRDKLLGRHGAVHIVDRQGVHGAVRPVDASDQTLDLAAEFAVRIDVTARRDGHLDVAHPVSQGRVTFQHLAHGLEPSGNALCVIQTIDAKDDAPAAGVASDFLDAGLHPRTGCKCTERACVYAHRKHADVCIAITDAHPIDLGFNSLDVEQRRHEMSQIRKGVESDQVRPEHSVENRASPWEGSKDL